MKREPIDGLEPRLRKLLKQKKVTIKKLCEITGISHYAMKIILDTSSIHPTEAKKITKVLDTTKEYLLTGQEPPKADIHNCKLFRCVYTSKVRTCCFYCSKKDTCKWPCLNDPTKCNRYERKEGEPIA